MRTLCLPLLLAACVAPPESWEGHERPADHQAPPGVEGITLSGPTTVAEGIPYRWAVRDADLAPGDVVQLGWGSLNAPGFCPHRALAGGTLCIDITRAGGRAVHLGQAIAELDPLDPSRAVAYFDVTVPNTPRDHIFLQAMLVKGAASATSNVLRVDIPNFPACPSLTADIDSPADMAAYAGCTTLSSIRISNPSIPVDVLEFPVLQTMTSNIIIGLGGSSGLVRAHFPQLQSTAGNIYVGPGDSVGTIEAPKLTTLRQLTLSANAAIHTLELPVLETAEDISLVAIDNLDVLFLPQLSEVTGQLSYASSDIPRIGFQSLTDVGETLSITNNDFTESIELPMLETIGGEFTAGGMMSLDQLDTPALASVGDVLIFSNPLLCVDRPLWESASTGTVDITGNLCN